jgi:beta-glucosidase
MTVSKTEFGPEDTITVTVDVTNTSDVAGKESVLLFSSDIYASSTPDVRRLRAFDKIELAPAETKTVTFEVSAKDLAFVNYYGKWTLEAGDFALSVGDQNTMVKCVETVVWDEPNID